MDAETLKQVEALRRTMEYYKRRALEAEALLKALRGELSKAKTDVTYPAQVA